MKKLISLSLFLFLAGACDKIPEGEYIKEPTDNGNDCTPTLQSDTLQRVLLEEFTGVKCNNCPEANRQAKNLQTVYGDQLILLAIHAGNLATTDAQHPRAFNTEEGTELFNFFNLFGVPVGFVNRKDYSSASPFDIIKLQADWGNEVQTLLNESPEVAIGINEVDFNANNRNLIIDGRIEVLAGIPEGDIYYSVYLAENNIISPQTMGDKTVNANYEHNHVFRGSFNGTYGEPIDLSAGCAEFSKEMIVDNEIVKENCEVIVFVYQRDNYRILQVNKIDL